ncbi:alpha/beta hydrolase [Faunimonas sp. B44]|uniref:alpha/beta hydrolase n=1 Tax=Faunimonas sp. B44 TaxID=3461493 RepID=UPI0040447D50
MNAHTQPRHVTLTHGALHVWEANAPSEFALLFVHGAYHGAWCYTDYCRYFSNLGFRCGAIDLRGHGALPQDALFVKSGQQEMADDVIEGVRALGGETILVGHSAGGAVAAVAAARVRSEGLVLLAPAPPGQLAGIHPLPTVSASEPVPPPDPETAHRRFFPNHDRQDSDALWRRLVPESPALLNDRRRLSVRIDRTRISGPVLLIAAGRDDGAMHTYGQDYETARFYDAEYHFVEDAGHCFMLEPEWEREARIIRRWLTRNFALRSRE